MKHSTFTLRTGKRRRRGGIYVAVLGAAMLVTVIGLGALTASRLRGRDVTTRADMADARACALAAAEFGRNAIASTPAWRTSHNNGVWTSGMTFGNGTFSLAVTNPPSNNLNNSPTDPVWLTGTGYKGRATQIVKVQLAPANGPLELLQAALNASSTITFNSASVTCNGLISSNFKVSASSSQVGGYVEGTKVSGSSYTNPVRVISSPRTFPDSTHAFDFYKQYGTYVNMTKVPLNGSTYQVQWRLISPTSNPFDGTPNYAGIYIFDCGGNNVLIQNCRIVGTIVLLNVGYSSSVQSAVNWAPAVANYPALLVQGTFSLQFDDTKQLQDKASQSANFNPGGTPYQGVSDATYTTVYPVTMQGLVYVSGNLTLSSNPKIDGCVIVGGYVTCSGNTTLIYEPTFYNTPPPGFIDSGSMKVVYGTWTQVVN